MGVVGAPVVVKLGGSFAFSKYLRNWLDALTSCGGRVVIVPGGGPFADAVRSAQSAMVFDDAAAHYMALLAMEQYGHALISLNRLLVPADSIETIEREVKCGRVPVWMPARMVAAASEIAESWDVTSDSLAAWLSGKLQAGRLLLIKHLKSPVVHKDLAELAATGIVDKAFPRYAAVGTVTPAVFGETEYEAVIAAIHAATDSRVEAQSRSNLQPQRC